eukprot:scaffold33138_cov129-Isochrysis_galbana.AAC.1
MWSFLVCGIRSDVTQNNKEIVEEFAHYYAHLARPKPSHNPETLLDAVRAAAYYRRKTGGAPSPEPKT